MLCKVLGAYLWAIYNKVNEAFDMFDIFYNASKKLFFFHIRLLIIT